jgi:hypothetical protein
LQRPENLAEKPRPSITPATPAQFAKGENAVFFQSPRLRKKSSAADASRDSSQPPPGCRAPRFAEVFRFLFFKNPAAIFAFGFHRAPESFV